MHYVYITIFNMCITDISILETDLISTDFHYEVVVILLLCLHTPILKSIGIFNKVKIEIK